MGELGVTGGEEDGVDNSDVDSSKLYTQPEEVYEVYTALNAVKGGRFTIAAAFGNVHGVYSPGNVQLTPDILHNCQKYIKEKDSCDAEKPATFVFHGGSGSSREDIHYAIEAGTVKMNIDTDTQWAFRDGLRSYEAEFRPYLQGQIGNPDGDEKPNKKYYDPCSRPPRTSTASTSSKGTLLRSGGGKMCRHYMHSLPFPFPSVCTRRGVGHPHRAAPKTPAAVRVPCSIAVRLG